MHRVILLSIDLSLIALSTLLAAILSNNFNASPDLLRQIFPYFLLTMAPAAPALLASASHRSLWRFTSFADCTRLATAIAFMVLFAVLATIAFDAFDTVPRTLPVVQLLLMTGTLIGTRAAMRLRHAIRARKRSRKQRFPVRHETVLIVGLNEITELFLRCISANDGRHIQIAGIVSSSDRHRGRLLRSCPILGRPEQLRTILHDLEVHGIRIERIVVATQYETLPDEAREALLQIEKTTDVRIDRLTEMLGLDETTEAANTVESSLSLDPAQFPSQEYLRWKRAFDVMLAIVFAVCLAPLMLLAGIIVVCDVGYPPIFWQQRPGALGLPIRVLKFRTMGPVHDLQGRRLPDEERLSAAGRFLRRSRLDELPQILNVLAGQMSFVGPRPLLPADQSPRYAARLGLRPGLTGWAQIKGGRHLSIHDKAALDLWYVKHASFPLDLAILIGTLRTVLFGERIDPQAIRLAWQELGCDPAKPEETLLEAGDYLTTDAETAHALL